MNIDSSNKKSSFDSTPPTYTEGCGKSKLPLQIIWNNYTSLNQYLPIFYFKPC